MTDAEKLTPWISAIASAAAAGNSDPYQFAALALRESGAGWAPTYWPKGSAVGWGDGATQEQPELGHGFGLFQLDRRWHAPFISSPAAQTVAGQATYACKILATNRIILSKSPLHLTGDALERAAFAAYNAGTGPVLAAILRAHDPDACTAHHDYSSWIFAKAEELRIAAPDLF
jgi:hypothetical protein